MSLKSLKQKTMFMLAGHYQVEQVLSEEGGFGKTFLARDIHLPNNPLCVVKQLKPRQNNSETLIVAKRLFDKEAKALQKLGNHDQIPRLLAHFEQDNEFYLVQEYIQGHNLNQEITYGKQLSESYVIKLLQDTLEVLAFVHQNNVIHRDIKPGNLIRRKEDGKIVLIDFGAVKEIRTQVTNNGQTIYTLANGQITDTLVIGTLGYMPSEQAMGKPRFSSDLYALGIVCLQALSGLFPGELPENSQDEYCCQVLINRQPVSPSLTTIINKMVRDNYRERYANATEALEALNQLLNGNSVAIEPISGCLSWVFLTGVMGFDDVFFKSPLSKLINSCQSANPSEKYLLQQVTYRALLKAKYQLTLEYRNELGGWFPTFKQFSPFYSQEQKEALRWVNQKIAFLEREINSPNYQQNIELTTGLNSMLTPLLSVNEIFDKQNKLLKAVRQGDEPAGYTKRVGGILELVCKYFAEEIKSDRNLANILSSLFGSEFTLDKFTSALVNYNLDKSELERKFARENTSNISEANQSSARELNLEQPSGQVSLNSTFYIERPPIEADCYEAILKPAALIRIKAPRQMGKTSLMSRIIDKAKQSGCRTACLNFQSADSEFLTNLDGFLQWFCASITEELEMEVKLAEYWTGPLGSKNKCTKYFQKYLLTEINNPLVLGLDEIDQIFQYSDMAIDFFGMLRAWHEKGKNEELWQKLRLVIVHSKEVYIPMNINQSPFNVGLPIDLPELTQKQVQSLVGRHGLNWSQMEVEQLMEMVGGHPYLVRQALYQIARERMTLPEFLELAPTESGPFADHLRRHLYNIQENPDLLSAIKQVITANNPVKIGTEASFKLRSMGLVKMEGNAVMILCGLYRQYFGDRLS